jgi:hypothetical protein
MAPELMESLEVETSKNKDIEKNHGLREMRYA